MEASSSSAIHHPAADVIRRHESGAQCEIRFSVALDGRENIGIKSSFITFVRVNLLWSRIILDCKIALTTDEIEAQAFR